LRRQALQSVFYMLLMVSQTTIDLRVCCLHHFQCSCVITEDFMVERC
jgi:hypothetical protein